MREIKLRAWDHTHGKMVYPHNCDDQYYLGCDDEFKPVLNVWDDDQESYYQCDSEVMQYTGLKDCNGVEIYTGDIVGFGDDTPKSKLGLYGALGRVFFEEEVAAFNVNLSDGRIFPLADHMMFADKKTCRKVYGNIYENPDLLN